MVGNRYLLISLASLAIMLGIAACSSKEQQIEEKTIEYREDSRLLGEWKNVNANNNESFIFEENNVFTKKSGKKSTFWGTYTVNSQWDSLYVFKYDSIYEKYKMTIFGDSMILLKENMNNAKIEDILLFSKGKTLYRQTQQYIIPGKALGDIFVCFPPIGTGQKGFMGMVSNRVEIEIGKSRLAKTDYELNPLAYLGNSIEFYWQPHSNLSRQRIPHFKFDDFLKNQNNYTDLDSETLNKVYVAVYGFNKVDDQLLEQAFNKPIENDIFWFRIDTLKNLLQPSYPDLLPTIRDTLPDYVIAIVYGKYPQKND